MGRRRSLGIGLLLALLVEPPLLMPFLLAAPLPGLAVQPPIASQVAETGRLGKGLAASNDPAPGRQPASVRALRALLAAMEVAVAAEPEEQPVGSD